MVGLLLCKFEVPQRQQLASEDSVPETPSYGTEGTLGAQKGFLWYATRFQKHSVQKTGFYGTGGIFGAKNSLLWYATRFQRPAEQPTPQAVDSLLWYATRFRRRTVPKAALAAPDASSVRETPTARR